MTGHGAKKGSKPAVERGMRILGEAKGSGGCVKFTPDQLLEAFYEYKIKCVENGNVMTINGFGLSAGFHRDTLLSYRKEHKGYEEVLDIIDSEMLEDVVQKGYQMKNPAFAIFHLKNSFGWKDKEETNVNVVNVIQQMDSDDRRAKIRELLRQKDYMQITGSGVAAESGGSRVRGLESPIEVDYEIVGENGSGKD
jgi:hypothetical protein